MNVAAAARRLPDHHVWLRVADTGWAQPLDPSWAQAHGGRWNAPGSFPVLYLNEDLATARAQLLDLLVGWPTNPEDLRDDAPYVLLLAEIPRRQMVADALTDAGLGQLGLPPSYPFDAGGRVLPHAHCQPIGAAVHEAGLRGVWCRSARKADGTGSELAWFPAATSSRARPLGAPVPFAQWWTAESTGQLLRARSASGVTP